MTERQIGLLTNREARPMCEWRQTREDHVTSVNLVWSDKVFLSLVSGNLGHAYHDSGGWQLISVGQLLCSLLLYRWLKVKTVTLQMLTIIEQLLFLLLFLNYLSLLLLNNLPVCLMMTSTNLALSQGTPLAFALVSLSLIHIWRCRRSYACRSRWSPYH